MSTRMGILIKNARLLKNLSQGHLAKKLGLTSPQFISNMERGLCGCPVPMAKKLIKLLNIEEKVLKKAIVDDIVEHLNKEWK